MIEIPATTVTACIAGKWVVFKTADWLPIDRHNLEEEMARQAAAHGWITITMERAKKEALLIEAELDDEDARFAAEYRSTKKDLSETEIKQAIKGNPKHRVLVRKAIEADQRHREMQALSYAMIHRMEMLKALSKARGGELSLPSPSELAQSKRTIMRGTAPR